MSQSSNTAVKNTALEQSQAWLAQYAGLQLPGSQMSWLNQQREQALEHFKQVGLPGIRDEEWRYTNLRAIKNNAYIPAASSDQTIHLEPTTNSRLVFVDGFYREDLSSIAGIEGSVKVLNLAAALATDSDILANHLGGCMPKVDVRSAPSKRFVTVLGERKAQEQQHGFSALNTAFFQDGYALILPQNSILEGVLEVMFVASANSKDDVQDYPMSHVRNLIIAGANTECTVVERHIGSDGSVYLNNSITEIHAGENAHIDHYKIQQESADAFHIGGVFIKQAASSQVKNHNLALSGLVTRNDINSDLLGQGAHIEMNGLVLGKGRQHVDNHTEVNHAVANCTSDEFYKTVLDGHSRSVFRGRIIVAQDAQLTNADQQNNNLLLSKTAEADTKPQLEIYADDVKCSHGATVGQLDPKSLFYLRSRGIDVDSANALLTFAFANEVIERIKVKSVKRELTQIIAGQLLSGLEELV